MRPYGAHCPCRRCCTPDRLLIPTSSAPCAGSRPAATRLPTGSCAPASWSEAGTASGPARSPPGWAVTPRPCGSGCTASTPTVSTGSVTDPGRLDQTQRGQLVALVRQDPTGRLVRQADGTLAAVDPQQPAVWTLDALVQAAHELGIAVERSQVRRILLEEGHAGGTRARGRPVLTQSSSQKGPSHRPLYPPAGRGDGGLLRRARSFFNDKVTT